MAKKRTKKDKKKTTQRRKQSSVTSVVSTSSYSLTDDMLQSETKSSRKKNIQPTMKYDYDPSLILADLKKTIILSGVIFATLAAIYYAAQTGYMSMFGY